MKAIALVVFCLALEAAFLLHLAMPGGVPVALHLAPREEALAPGRARAALAPRPERIAAEPCVEGPAAEEQARSL